MGGERLSPQEATSAPESLPVETVDQPLIDLNEPDSVPTPIPVASQAQPPAEQVANERVDQPAPADAGAVNTESIFNQQPANQADVLTLQATLEQVFENHQGE